MPVSLIETIDLFIRRLESITDRHIVRIEDVSVDTVYLYFKRGFLLFSPDCDLLVQDDIVAFPSSEGHALVCGMLGKCVQSARYEDGLLYIDFDGFTACIDPAQKYPDTLCVSNGIDYGEVYV